METSLPIAGEIERGLRALGSAERAAGAKRYLKSDLEFIGVATEPFRTAITTALRAAPASDRTALLAAVCALWARPVFELRAAAVELLDRNRKLLEKGDIKFVERFLRESRTWALVDWLAAAVAGALVERFPELGRELDRWARDGDFWVRRAALLALLPPLRRGGGDFGRFARYADAMLDEREFFIRKAIGWVLREVSKKRPDLVAEWLRPRVARASGVTVREAVKYLPAGPRAALLERHRATAAERRRGAHHERPDRTRPARSDAAGTSVPRRTEPGRR